MKRLRGGFTLIEVLIVIAIIIILGVITVVNLTGSHYKNAVDSTAQQMVTLARQAQDDAASQLQDATWGIHFSNATNTSPFYSLFQGSAYTTTSTLGSYPLPSGVAYLPSSLASGATLDVTFAPVSGAASASTSITIYSLANPGFADTISINSLGLVSLISASGYPSHYVQSVSRGDTSTSTYVDSMTAPFASANTASDTIIVSADWWGGGQSVTASLTDTEGNTYVPAPGPLDSMDGNSRIEIWYAKNIKAGANTVTMTLSSPINGGIALAIHEFSGLDLSNPLDTTIWNTASGTALTTGSTTTNFAKELLFAFDGGDAGASYAASPFTGMQSGEADVSEYETVNATGTYSGVMTQSLAYPYVIGMATFKGSGGTISDKQSDLEGSEYQDVLDTPFASPNTASDTIVVAADWPSQTATGTITDTAGNTYAVADGPRNSNDGTSRTEIWYATNIKAGANTVTLTLSSLPAGSSAFVLHSVEYSGINTTAPLDVTSWNTNTSTNLDSGSAVTTDSSGDVIFGFGVPVKNVSSTGVGFISRANFENTLVEDKTVGSPGSYSTSMTQSSSSAWIMMMAAFKL